MSEQSKAKLNFKRSILKDIEIEGEITTLGEYHEDYEFRSYKGVTITDKENNQLFLTMLLIPKSLSDQIRVGEKAHLKIARIKNNKHLMGAVYALVSSKDDKWYYDSLASPKGIKAYIVASYKRASGGVGTTMMCSVFLFLLLWGSMGIPLQEAVVTGILSFGLSLTFALWPYVIAPNLTGVSEFIDNLKNNGAIDIRRNAESSKY